MTSTYNIEVILRVEKDWSRDEVIGKLEIALGAVGIINKLNVGLQIREDGARLNRDLQIASGNNVLGKLTKEEEETKRKGWNKNTLKARAE